MMAQLKRKKSAIYSSLIKHGYSNFKLEILEYCDKSNVIVREQAYIDLLSPEYNLNKTAGSRFGSKHSEETKRIISEKLKGEKNPMFGKNHSDETRKKMSDNISTSQRLEVFDIKNNQITTYDSIHEAARVLNIKQSIITMYFTRNQKKPYKGLYTFKKL
jgi:NUMOD3 motif/NUMOD1 domain